MLDHQKVSEPESVRSSASSAQTLMLLALALCWGKIGLAQSPPFPPTSELPPQSQRPLLLDACETPVPREQAADVVRPRKLRDSPPSPRILAKWTPVAVKAVISCSGEVVSIEVPARLPAAVCEEIHRSLAKWRFKPAELAGTPVAVRFNLVLGGRENQSPPGVQESPRIEEQEFRLDCSEPD